MNTNIKMPPKKEKTIPNNKVLDINTGKIISVATALKRIKRRDYDINSFILGENLVYNKRQNSMLDKNVLEQQRAERKENVKIKKEFAKQKSIVNFKTFKKLPQTMADKTYGRRTIQVKYNHPYTFKMKSQKIFGIKDILKDVNSITEKNKKPNSMARITLQSKNAPMGKQFFSTRVSKNPDVGEIEEQIERIINSDEKYDIKNSTITIRYYDVPQGQGSINIPTWLKEKSKSVYIIENDDKLCGQRCLVLGMADTERRKYLKKSEKAFLKEVANLNKYLKCDGGMNFLDFDKFVEIYPTYKVSIVSDLNTILYETNNADYTKEIWLYYDNRQEHYHFVNNIDGFFNNKNGHYKYCRGCKQRLEKRVFDKHKCVGLKCNLCHQTFNTQEEKDAHMTCKKSRNCIHCNLKCRGDKCLELHEAKCKGKMWFYDCCLKNGFSTMECWGRPEDKEHHKCDHKYCSTCNEYLPRIHRCAIKPREQKDKGMVSLIAFDFESFIDEETGEHQVNYIVAEERGTNNRWRWEYQEGKDILKEFIDFVLTKSKTTFVAHNGKSYDTWLIHHHLTKHYNERPSQIILAGQKIMYMEIKSVKFIDSCNHFACKLEDVPKTFGLDETQFKKGFYPYKFNTKENWNYEGEMPDIKYFDPCSMKTNKRMEFFKWWYDKKKSNYIWKHKKETKEYCDSDVDILLQGCNVYSQEGYDLVGIDPLEKKTIASWVMDIYLKNFYDFDKTPIYVLEKIEYDFIRRSFHGGRTEAIRLYRKWNKEELQQGICGRYLDIQSLYPTTQFYDPLPIGIPKTKTEFGNIDNHEYIKTNYGWYEVDIKMNKELFIPPLVAKDEKLTADLNDKVKQVFHSEELKRAIEDGCEITKIYQSLEMETSTDLFKDFVKTFLEVKVNATGKPKLWDNKIDRQKWIKEHEDRFGFTPNPTEKNDGKRAIAKMILNSLWGKFGQRPDMPKNIYITPDKVNKWWQMLSDCKNGKIDIKGEELTGDTLFVSYKELDDKENYTLKTTSLAIASSITACATMRLYAELRLLKERVLYMDTDSIIYEHHPDKYNIPSGKFLGEWECETDGLPITEYVSTGAKSYAYKVQGKVKDVKMKGITLNWENCKDINFKSLKSLVDGKDKLTTKQNVRFNKTANGINTTMMEKDIKFTMDKRQVKGYWSYPLGYEGKEY